MAEFSELVQIKKRMCNEFGKNICKGCPLLHKGCEIIAILGQSDYEFKELEDTLLLWAAEHQVVYPTWGEWLESIGVAQVGSGMLSIHPAIAEQPIPADIAQKLGIEPKEG